MLLAAMALIVAAPAAGEKPICQNDQPQSVGSFEEGQLKRLDELPPANHVLTVLRAEDGCSAPVIVRHGIGAPAKIEK
jgi:hypothetical protein